MTGTFFSAEHHFLSFQTRDSYHTHDVGQDSTRGADERAHDGQQVVVEQETLRTQGPAWVAVQHRDDDWHVRTPNSSRQSHPLGRKAKCNSKLLKHLILNILVLNHYCFPISIFIFHCWCLLSDQLPQIKQM